MPASNDRHSSTDSHAVLIAEIAELRKTRAELVEALVAAKDAIVSADDMDDEQREVLAIVRAALVKAGAR